MTWDLFQTIRQLPSNGTFDLQHPHTLATDSRTLQPGQWYLPLTGAQFDGHAFINDVMSKGAGGFIYSESKRHLFDAKWLASGIPVTETLAFYQEYASLYRQTFEAPFIAITGSSGKTTTKELLAAGLRALGTVTATTGNNNNEIGVPKTVLAAKASDSAIVVEMGARHVGDIGLLTEMVDPDVSCLLNTQEAHVGEFGNLTALRATKLEILRNGSRLESGIIFRDDEELWQSLSRSEQKYLFSFGYHEDAHIRILKGTPSPSGMVVDLAVKPHTDKHLRINLPIFHQALPYNVAAAIACCFGIGADLEAVATSMANYQPLKGRFQMHRIGGKVIIDDSYNANPSSMLAGIGSVIRQFPQAETALVLGDMLELGEQADQKHLQVAEYLCENPTAVIVTIGSKSRIIHEKLQRNLNKTITTCHFDDVDTYLSNDTKLFENCRTVYFKGSHSIGLQRAVEAIMESTSPVHH